MTVLCPVQDSNQQSTKKWTITDKFANLCTYVCAYLTW